ncbi:MAG: class I SAM-dependent methyltransferase [Candidatus Pacebacteria bacterium]|nr:class I SAM-dependent methyltransferase [Candidatus Paceibacterota bacterium]
MYFKKGRWISIWDQIQEIMKEKPVNVLNVGAGHGILGFFLKTQTNIKYTSLDINKGDYIDIVADARDIPLEDKSFDLVCSFQTIEHIPYEDAMQVIREMKRVTKNKIIISVPHSGRGTYIDIKLPFIRKIKWFYWKSFNNNHKYNGVHYWELGTKQVSVKKFKKDIELKLKLKIEKEFKVFEKPYYHFFVLKKI